MLAHTHNKQTDSVTAQQSNEISLSDVEKAISKFKNRKTVDHDGITAKMLRRIDGEAKQILIGILNLAWMNRGIPKD